MDPNSLAGLKQGTVADHADWDVGGVSGAELINSVVTVLFGDGSTAFGTITSDGSQAGGIAVVGGDIVQAPGVSVNGIAAGGTGAFRAAPTVFVSGKPGEKVRVSKMTGFDPVNNQVGLDNGKITTEALVTARLRTQYPSFPVNNAKEWQHVDVVIPTSGFLDISNKFTTDKDYPMAFTAVVLDASGLPISMTAKPIRLVPATTQNILINGSFEANKMSPGKLGYLNDKEVEGWNLLNGQPIELWGTGVGGVFSIDGQNLIELDAHGQSKLDAIYQDVKTQKDRVYELSFFLRARQENGLNMEDETLYVEWNGELIKPQFRASEPNAWTEFVETVTGTGGTDRLTFRESSVAGASNGLGVLLDNIELRPREGLLPTIPTEQNLLENGSFENKLVKAGTIWYANAYEVDGWASAYGEKLELWGTGKNGVAAVDGRVFLELDNRRKGKTDAIYQNIQTQKGNCTKSASMCGLVEENTNQMMKLLLWSGVVKRSRMMVTTLPAQMYGRRFLLWWKDLAKKINSYYANLVLEVLAMAKVPFWTWSS